jgi:N-acetylglucosaminyldiphosphoundecaprenol N-acetyl-beta-D-mannosaminyltransferase
VEILGVPVHAVSLVEAEEQIASWVSSRKRPPVVVVHTNAFSLVTAQEDPVYRQFLKEADLSLPDGKPLVWLLSARGHNQEERVYGPDLMLQLCARAAREGWSCYLFGGHPGTPEKVKDALLARFPSLKIVGMFSPPFRSLTEGEDEQIVRAINSLQPDVVWVALGGPKQDMWMLQHRSRIDAAVLHGVGAAFDFLSGRVPQAPRWMRSAGLEWLFRFLVEPRRLWKRYTLKNAKFLYFVLRQALTPDRSRRVGENK